MLSEIEKTIRKYFPANWSKKQVIFFLKTIGFKIDLTAVNKGLNIPVRDFVLRGGKRLRPILFLKSLEILGVDYKKFFNLAVAIELAHNGTLILDDIEDNGELRRGKPSCHKKFGLDVATNTGATLYTLPLTLILNNPKLLKEKQIIRLCKIYSEEMTNVGFGQSMDIYWHNNPKVKVTDEKYLEMVRLKTGSLMRMSLRMACAVADKSEKVEECFKKFGESIGMAFQIRDDSLDLIAKDKRFGKSYGNDITEGKMSLPVVFALKSASKRDKSELLEILNKHTKDAKKIKKAISIILKKDAVGKSIEYANKLVDEAWLSMKKDCRTFEKINELKDLTYFFVKREY